MDIADIATPDYTELEAESKIGKARAIFEEDNPKGIIVTRAGKYEGVITQKQLLRSHIEDHTKVDTLTKSAPKVERTANIRDVARALVEGGTKVVPVFESENLWGVVDQDLILEAVLEHLDTLTIADIYTENVVTIADDASLGRAINRLREHGVSRLPVTDEDGLLTGVVTTHDVVNFATRSVGKTTRGDRSGEGDRLLDLPVSDVMSSPAVTAAADETAREAVERMLDTDYSGLVVTPADDDRVIEGVVTKTDVLRALSYTEEDVLDVQITNASLLDTLSRESVRTGIEQIVDKYEKMSVRHAHVRFHEHKEQLRGTPLIQCKIRLRTNRGQVAGSGEGYGAEQAFNVARGKLERNVLERKGIESDREYEGQLLRKLGEL